MDSDVAEQIPRILITRLSHIGDCVLTMPMLSAIRDFFPHAYIGWAVEKPSDQLIKHHPNLDETIVIPKGWMAKPKLWMSVRNELQRHNFDVAIDLDEGETRFEQYPQNGGTYHSTSA